MGSDAKAPSHRAHAGEIDLEGVVAADGLLREDGARSPTTERKTTRVGIDGGCRGVVGEGPTNGWTLARLGAGISEHAGRRTSARRDLRELHHQEVGTVGVEADGRRERCVVPVGKHTAEQGRRADGVALDVNRREHERERGRPRDDVHLRRTPRERIGVAHVETRPHEETSRHARGEALRSGLPVAKHKRRRAAHATHLASTEGRIGRRGARTTRPTDARERGVAGATATSTVGRVVAGVDAERGRRGRAPDEGGDTAGFTASIVADGTVRTGVAAAATVAWIGGRHGAHRRGARHAELLTRQALQGAATVHTALHARANAAAHATVVAVVGEVGAVRERHRAEGRAGGGRRHARCDAARRAVGPRHAGEARCTATPAAPTVAVVVADVDALPEAVDERWLAPQTTHAVFAALVGRAGDVASTAVVGVDLQVGAVGDGHHDAAIEACVGWGSPFAQGEWPTGELASALDADVARWTLAPTGTAVGRVDEERRAPRAVAHLGAGLAVGLASAVAAPLPRLAGGHAVAAEVRIALQIEATGFGAGGLDAAVGTRDGDGDHAHPKAHRTREGDAVAPRAGFASAARAVAATAVLGVVHEVGADGSASCASVAAVGCPRVLGGRDVTHGELPAVERTGTCLAHLAPLAGTAASATVFDVGVGVDAHAVAAPKPHERAALVDGVRIPHLSGTFEKRCFGGKVSQRIHDVDRRCGGARAAHHRDKEKHEAPAHDWNLPTTVAAPQQAPCRVPHAA